MTGFITFTATFVVNQCGVSQRYQVLIVNTSSICSDKTTEAPRKRVYASGRDPFMQSLERLPQLVRINNHPVSLGVAERLPRP